MLMFGIEGASVRSAMFPRSPRLLSVTLFPTFPLRSSGVSSLVSLNITERLEWMLNGQKFESPFSVRENKKALIGGPPGCQTVVFLWTLAAIYISNP